MVEAVYVERLRKPFQSCSAEDKRQALRVFVSAGGQGMKDCEELPGADGQAAGSLQRAGRNW